MSEDTKQLQHPTPTPGWVCVAKVDQQESSSGQVFPTPNGGFMTPSVQIVAAIVVAQGNWTEEQIEMGDDQIGLFVYPYPIGSKVYFASNTHTFEVNGYTFLQWNQVLCYELEEGD